MRTVRRQRRYVSSTWLTLLGPLLRYSASRDAYVLSGIGGRVGPVLRENRRHVKRRRLRGPERRHSRAV